MKSSFLSGCEWHPRIKTARNHFIYNDLPHFIIDSYEECREPPRVHQLDKYVENSFDSLPPPVLSLCLRIARLIRYCSLHS